MGYSLEERLKKMKEAAESGDTTTSSSTTSTTANNSTTNTTTGTNSSSSSSIQDRINNMKSSATQQQTAAPQQQKPEGISGQDWAWRLKQQQEGKSVITTPTTITQNAATQPAAPQGNIPNGSLREIRRSTETVNRTDHPILSNAAKAIGYNAASTYADLAGVIGSIDANYIAALERAGIDTDSRFKEGNNARVFGTDPTSEQSVEQAQRMFTLSDELAQKAGQVQADATDGKSPFSQKAFDAAVFLGNIGAHLAADAVIPGLGTTMYGLEAAGGASRNYRNDAGDNYDPNKAALAAGFAGGGVALGGAFSNAVNKAGVDYLAKRWMADKAIPGVLATNAGLGGLSGLAFGTGATIGSEAAKIASQGKDYKANVGEIASTLVTSAAFGAASRVINTLVTSEKSKAQLKQQFEDLQKLYAKATDAIYKADASSNYSEEEVALYADAVMNKAKEMFDAYSKLYVTGSREEVGEILKMLRNVNQSMVPFASYSPSASASSAFVPSVVSEPTQTERGNMLSLPAPAASEVIPASPFVPTYQNTALAAIAQQVPNLSDIPTRQQASAAATPTERVQPPPVIPAQTAPVTAQETPVSAMPAQTADVPAQIEANNQNAIAAFAKTLGQNGARALTNFYGSGDAAAYIKGMMAAYNAGKAAADSGNAEVSAKSIPASAAPTLTDTQRQAAFIAGQADAQLEARAKQDVPETVTPTKSLQNEPERGTMKTKNAKLENLLWTTPENNNGWKRKYNGDIPIYDALKLVDTELTAAFEADANREGSGEHPIIDAYVAAWNDVRQDTISPMAAAHLLSDAYKSGGIDGLRALSVRSTGNLTKEALETAKQIDKARKGGVTNGRQGQEVVHLRDGGERAYGENPGGSLRGVETGAGRDQSGYAEARPADGEALDRTYDGKQKVSSAQLGVEGGYTDDEVYIYTGRDTAATSDAKRVAKERGLNLVLFYGGDIHAEKAASGARGYYNAEKNLLLVRVDDANYTSSQIARHEAGHDMIAKGEVNTALVRERCRKAAPDGKIENLADLYASAYEKAGVSPEEAWEECICDSLGNMNVFSPVFESSSKFVEDAQQTIRSVTEELRQQRGPPTGRTGNAGKFSRKEDSNGQRGSSAVLARGVQNAERGKGNGRTGTVVGRGNNENSRGSNKEILAPERLTDYQKAVLEESLLAPLESNAEYGFILSQISPSNALELICQRISEGDPFIEKMAKVVPEFGKAIDEAVAFVKADTEHDNKTPPAREHTAAEMKRNEQYMQAVKRGDMKTAQKLVDEAAKEAGYNVSGYHGTTATFDEFKLGDVGYHIGTEKQAKDRIADAGDRGHIKKLYASVHNPLSTAFDFGDWKGKNVAGMLVETEQFEEGFDKNASEINARLEEISNMPNNRHTDKVLRDYLKSLGYDSIAYDNQFEDVHNASDYSSGVSYILFDSDQLKSAEPVTYDKSGNVIPLIERFNPNDDDIRYSQRISDLDELRADNAALREKVEYWRGQTKRTTEPSVRADDVKRVAREIIKGYDSTLKADDISAALTEVGNYLVRGGEDMTYKGLKERVAPIAREIVNNASALMNGDEMETFREVKAFLRQKMRISPRDAANITDYNEWRKHYFGKINVSISEENGTPVDTVYSELSDRFPWLFPEMPTPADELLQMADVLDSLTPVYSNPYSYDMAQAIEYCVNDIIDALISEQVRQTPPTFADKQAAKLEAAKAETKQAENDAFLAGQMAQGRKMAQELREEKERTKEVREQKNAKIDELQRQAKIDKDEAVLAEKMAQGRKMAKNRRLAKEAIANERERRKKQISAIREHYADIEYTKIWLKAESDARTRLLHIVRRLRNRKLPAVNRALLDQYIGDIDTVSKSLTGKTVKKLNELEDWYLDRKKNDPDFISDPKIEESLRRLHSKHIGDMTVQEVLELTDILLNIENELRTERKTIDTQDRRDTYMQGVQTISDVTNSRGSKGGWWDKLVTTELLSPTRELHRVTGYADDDPLYLRTKELADGQRKMFDYQRRAEARFEKWANDKKFIRRIMGKHAEEIKIVGMGEDGATEVIITPAMRMSLFLHSLNGQNLLHIDEGGISVPDIKLYKQGKIAEAYDRGKTIRLRPSNVRSITAHMTEQEKAFAMAAHDYFNGMSRDAVNETSEKLKGYSLASVEDYFPINTDRAFLRSDFESLKFDGTLEGMGFLKERIDAKNPLLLLDMPSVLTRSIGDHARYYGLAIPVRNFNKVYGVTKMSFNDDGSRNSFDSSVQKAIGQKWGSGATRYIEKFMGDLQNPAKPMDAWGSVLSKVRSNYAGAVLELNLSVAMKQAASYPTAAAVVGWGPLLKALPYLTTPGLHPNRAIVDKYTPLLWYRSQGYSNQELGDLAKQGKQLPEILNWIQGIDIKTTSALWKAAEYYVRDHNRSLERGSDAYYQEVANVYNRIIEETQPNYTTMQRPQLLRSDNELVKTLNMFKTQPFQNFNILYDALNNLTAKRIAYKNQGSAESKQSYKEAKVNAARAISSQAVSAFVFAAMQFAWEMLSGKGKKYKDDDDELTLMSWLKGMGFNVASSGFGMFPFGTEALELGEALTDKILKSFGKDPFFDQKFYGVDLSVTETANDTANDAMTAIVQTIGMIQKAAGNERLTDADWESYARTMYDAINDFMKLAGVPIDNVRKLGFAIAQNVFKATEGKYIGGYYALRLTSDPSRYASDYYDLLYDAYTHDKAAYKEVYKLMDQSKRFDEAKIKNAMEDRMKKAQGVSSTKDLDSRYMNPTQQSNYDAAMRRLERSPIWNSANATQKDDASDILYGLSTGSNDAATKSARDKINGGKSAGLDEVEYLLYTVALAMADQPNKNGKLGTYTNDEVEEAIRSVPGLSDEERAYLWDAAGKNEKTNPWR